MALITGDFFVAPPRTILDLEAALRGAYVDDAAGIIDRFFAEHTLSAITVTRPISARRSRRRWRPPRPPREDAHRPAAHLGRVSRPDRGSPRGRRIRFRYSRPFATGGRCPKPAQLLDGLVLLGGGPWGSAGDRNVPTLIEELTLTKAALQKGLPVLGIGLGAQLLSIVAGGSVQQTDFVFDVGEATRVEPGALEGYLPERFPLVVYGRDRPIPPDDARILAVDTAGHPRYSRSGRTRWASPGTPA